MKPIALEIRCPNGKQEGFTLIEALASLMIIALVMSLSVPYLHQVPPGPKLEATSRAIAGIFRLARTVAIARNSETVVAIDVASRLISLADHTPISLPEDMTIHVVFAEQERRSDITAGMRFFPDGSSSGGSVTLTLLGRKTDISVNWLDGSVRLGNPAGTVELAL